MNERIKELALQAGRNSLPYGEIELEKFADLIVQECIKVAMRSVSDDEPKEAWYLIEEHFGVTE